MGEIYARQGETVTCESGHPICDLARDIVYHSEPTPGKDFVNWQQPEPKIGELRPRCERCGGLWWSGAYLAQWLHFNDGWRGITAEEVRATEAEVTQTSDKPKFDASVGGIFDRVFRSENS